MRFTSYRLLVPLVVVALLFLAAVAQGVARAGGSSGAVYTMSNDGSANGVIAYRRAATGRLTEIGRFGTGGSGTGFPRLGSQGSVILALNNSRLLVTNGGSNDVSVFAVEPDMGLMLLQRIASGGQGPESVATRGNLVYVLNTGEEDNNITGFRFTSSGRLARLRGSTRPLSQKRADPAQVQFSPNGRTLVVTEKGTDRIDTFAVRGDGRTSRVRVHPSAGKTPFGFAFRKDGVLVVAEAFGGSPAKAAASSYSLTGARLRPVTRSAPDSQSDVCWTVITNDGRYAYVTNNGSGTISSYRIAANGTLTLLQARAATTGRPGGFGTRDVDLSDDGSYLYAIDVGTRTMNAYRVRADGRLTKVGVVKRLPATFAGVAAR